MTIEKNTLYLVGTPIGNLSDIAPRAVEVLAGVDFIAAEDTRVTAKLLNHLDISKQLISYYEHNKRERGEIIATRILAGETCALVTDAGLPAISDPGEDLVALCYEKGIVVSPIPGPCAAVSALCASGLPTGRFTFEGFLSTSNKKRSEHLAQIKDEARTMIFYEAPHKLLRTLGDLYDTLGDRRITLCRELTKLHEEFIHTTLKGALARFKQTPPKGEFVLVLEGAKKTPPSETPEEGARELLAGLLASGLSKKDAAAEAARQTGRKKNELYALALEIAQNTPDKG